MTCSSKSASFVLQAAALLLPGIVSAGVNSWRSAVAAEPSRIASFPVDGTTAPAIPNTVNAAYSGTLQTGASLSSTAARTVGTHSTVQSAAGRVALMRDPAWDFADGTGTVEAFLFQTGGAAYNPCYFSLRQDGSAGVRYSLHGDANGNNIHLWNGAAASSWAVSPTMTNRLCQVAIVFDGGNVTAYLNGVSLGVRANTLGSATAAPAQIGASGPGNSEAWPGHIDEVSLYADPLPAAAVSARYQAWLSNDSGTAPSITTQPVSLSRTDGQSAAFSVVLASTAGATYRWQRNGGDIPGATASTYTIPAVAPADHGAQFRCIVYNAFGGTLSATAALTVADLTPPALLSASAPYSPGVVILTFSEAVDLTGASFTIPGGTVTGFAAGAVPGTVVLNVTGLTTATGYNVTAVNVRDAAGNVLTSASTSFTAAPPPVPAPIELVRGGREPMGPATRRGGVVISEINYHPARRVDLQNLEFIEVCNTLPWTEDLSGFQLTGEVSYTFPAGTSIPAGGYLLVAAVPGDVQTVHSRSGVLGPWTGALNNAGGQLRLRDYSNAVVFEVNYDSGHPWQPAADGAGHSLILARPSYGMDNPQAWDRSFNLGGSPAAAEPGTADPFRTVMIDEVWSPLGLGDYIELYNYSSAGVDISGCTLSDDRDVAKYVFPAATTLSAGGFIRVEQAALGFGLKAGGDTAYFRAPGAPGRVLDAVRFGPQLDGYPWGRYPAGSPTWTFVDDDPPGPNQPAGSGPVVISEIFYNPPPGTAQLPFVEITNISGTLLNMGGWRLSGGVSYTIPTGTMLAHGAALAINAFSGSLNKGSGERLRLERPDLDPDGTGIVYSVADEVTYGTGGRWGRDSDGGGSSLEKRDLLSDGRLASNWADSNESGEAAWVTIEKTDIVNNGQGTANRLEVLLLGGGEALVDDVQLFSSTAPGTNIVNNPGFESGMTNWVANGTHLASGVDTGAGVTGNALHLRVTGRGDLAGNKTMNTLTTTATNGATYTLRAKVKYLRGHPEILLRLHGGYLEATGSSLGSIVCGTPGQTNSRNAANTGPAISGVTHRPVLPQTGQAATVFAFIDDRNGTEAALLNYRVDPSATVTSVLMQPRGAGLFSGDIPARSSGATVAFTVTAVDGLGAAATFPAAPAGEALIRWGETQPAGNTLASYRLWFTQATANTWSGRLKNSNDALDATFVAGDYRVIYNAGAMYSGSPFHTGGFNSPTGNACDYNVTVPSDDRYLGETDMIWAGPGTFASDTSLIREQAAWWIARKIGSPALHRRFVNVYINGVRRHQVMEDSQQPNGDFLDEHFSGDSGGPLYKAQDWIEYNDDHAGFQANTRAVLARNLSGGLHKISAYRYRWTARSVSSGNDYAAYTQLVDAFNTGASGTDPAFYTALDPLVDQDSWGRALACQRIVGNWDTWGWSYGKNMYAYKPVNGQWAMFAWDMDFGFGPDGSGNPAPDTATAGLFQNTSNFDGGAPGDPLATKFRTQVAFRRAYWCALLDAANGPMVPATFNARMDLITGALTTHGITINAAQLAQVKTYASDRRNYIITQANTVYAATTFGNTGGNSLTDADGILTLTGTAPANVKTFVINGVEYTPTWISETAWSLPLTLYSASNALTVNGLNYAGAIVGSFNVSITVTGPPPLPPVTINEWMADNTIASGFPDPADGNYEDWFELHNYGTTPVNLTGFHLTDTTAIVNQFQIPAGTIIPAGGWFLIWADNEPLQNGITPGQLHTNFRLSSGGEQIALYTPDGTLVDLLTFGQQAANQTEGHYPDSTAAIAALAPTPGRRNALTPSFLSLTSLGPAGIRTVLATEPTHSYQYETSTDLLTWSPAGAPFQATGSSVESTLPPSGPSRYWRARLLP